MRKALYILGDLAEEDIVFLSKAGQLRDLAPGEACIRAGEEVTALSFLTSGAMEVVVPRGPVVAQLAVGDVVGEMSFVERRLPDTDVVATEPTRLLQVPRAAIDAALARDTGFAARFYRAMAAFLSDRLRSLTARQGGSRSEELDDHLLDVVHVAGDRFNRLIAMMEGRQR
ncbi:MAG: cyclic nucleotide-binding domain-containing protein [Erythrobacter sp.]|nr:cyclic nucleotide-binding domain-containing protein [Erythrobacter sp.]